jgi:hypothetical protein
MYKYDILQVSNPKLTLNPKIGWLCKMF